MKTGLNKRAIRKHEKELRRKRRRKQKLAEKRAMTKKIAAIENPTPWNVSMLDNPSSGKVFRKGTR